jgi:hypothetical protein
MPSTSITGLHRRKREVRITFMERLPLMAREGEPGVQIKAQEIFVLDAAQGRREMDRGVGPTFA